MIWVESLQEVLGLSSVYKVLIKHLNIVYRLLFINNLLSYSMHLLNHSRAYFYHIYSKSKIVDFDIVYLHLCRYFYLIKSIYYDLHSFRYSFFHAGLGTLLGALLPWYIHILCHFLSLFLHFFLISIINKIYKVESVAYSCFVIEYFQPTVTKKSI